VGIPIVSEIFDGIRWVIDFFINKVPTPMKFFIFLLFLLFFGSMISLTLHLTGIHCNSAKQVVKVDFTDIGTNIALIWEDSKRTFVDETLTICDVHPDRCGQENECYFFARQLENGLYTNCNLTNSSSDCKYYLKEGVCHNCNNQEICFQESMFWIFCGNWHDVCIDNALWVNESTLTSALTGCGSACLTPKHYVWNITTGQYHCYDSEYCGVNATIVQSPVIDEKLLRAGAERVYATTQQDRDYRSVVRIKCNNNFNPRLTFFGIDIFDYKIWLFLAVIWVLVMLFFKLNRK